MKKILITGKMRSGTTFIANFLNSQKNGIIYSDFIRSPFIHGKKLQVDTINSQLSLREKNVLSAELEAEFNFNNYSLKVDRSKFDTWKGLFDYALNQITTIENVIINDIDFIGVKKTEETYYLKSLLDNGYQIIYMVRDPRDVFLSSKNRFSNYNLFDYMYKWEKSVKEALKFKNHPSFLFLSFEDLIRKDSSTINELKKFLECELDFDLKQLARHNKSKSYNDNSSFGDVANLFDQSAIDRWKKNLESDEVIFASFQFPYLLRKLNYPQVEQKINFKILKFTLLYQINKLKLKMIQFAMKLLKV